MAEIEDIEQEKPLITEATWGFLILRLWIGFRMLIAGAEKFYAEVTRVDEDGIETTEFAFAWNNYEVTARDNVYNTIDQNAFLPLNPGKFFEKVFHVDPDKVPGFFYQLELGLWFAYALPWLLLVFGFFLIIGLIPRISLAVAGFVFMALSIGLMALGDADGIAWLGIHIGLVSAALLMVRHSRFNLSPY